MTKTARRLEPIPPGEILLEEFMRPHGLSQNRLARDIDVNPARINDMVHGRSSITAAIALRLAKYFGTTPELWLNLQSKSCSSTFMRPHGLSQNRLARHHVNRHASTTSCMSGVDNSGDHPPACQISGPRRSCGSICSPTTICAAPAPAIGEKRNRAYGCWPPTREEPHDDGEGRHGTDPRRAGHADGRADALLLDPGGDVLGAGARRAADAAQAARREADRVPR